MLIWWPDINLKTHFCHVKRQICARGSVYTTSVWYKDRERTKAGLIWASCLKTRLLDINPSFLTTDVSDSHSLCCWCCKSSVLQKSALSPWRQPTANYQYSCNRMIFPPLFKHNQMNKTSMRHCFALPPPPLLPVWAKWKFGKLREILLLVTVHCSDLFVLHKSSDRDGEASISGVLGAWGPRNLSCHFKHVFPKCHALREWTG